MTIVRRDIEKRVWALLEPIVAVDDYELVEVEYTNEHGGWILRLYIDRVDGSVTVADTTKVTRLVDPILDVEDPIDHAYTLEVSSPGLDRPLRKPEHFSRFAGELVKIKTSQAVGEGRRRNLKGILKGYSDGIVTVDVDGTPFEVPHHVIDRAWVQYRFDGETTK